MTPYYNLGSVLIVRISNSPFHRIAGGHRSDHRAVIAHIKGGDPNRLRRYRKKVARFPIRLPPGPKTEAEDLFGQLKGTIERLKAREMKRNHWILAATWQLVDCQAQLKSWGELTQSAGRRLGRAINASLKRDRLQRAVNAADDIRDHLATGDCKEA